MTSAFTPVLYLKQGCPFCFKLQLFLLECGQLDRFTIREFVPGTPGEDAVRADLAPHVDKPTFPVARVAPGEYLKDSDGIIARYAEEASVDPQRLPTFQSYISGLLKTVISLHEENMRLKKRNAR